MYVIGIWKLGLHWRSASKANTNAEHTSACELLVLMALYVVFPSSLTFCITSWTSAAKGAMKSRRIRRFRSKTFFLKYS